MSRSAQGLSEQKSSTSKIHVQLQSIWGHVEEKAKDLGYKQERYGRRDLVNNNAWLSELPILKVLKLLGTGCRLGTMLGRDT